MKIDASAQLTITHLEAILKDEIYLVCARDDDEFGYPLSRISHYKDGNWSYFDYEFWISSLAFLADADGERLTLVGGRGEFVDFREPDEIIQIFDLDSKSVDELGFGRLAGLSQIGDHLYACGDGGQNYKRWENGQWSIFIDTLLEADGESEYDRLLDEYMDNPSLADDEQFNTRMSNALHDQGATTYHQITGLKESSIFLCGGNGNIRSALVHFDGKTTNKLELDYKVEDEFTPSLNFILFEDGEDRIRVCGQRGAMLVGNARDGFVQDPAAVEDIIYYNMAMYRDRIYIASTIGLLIHTGEEILRVRTGLEPDAIDTHTVQAVDDVLWVVGIKDILRFDGKAWERIPYPGNNPL